MSMFKNAVTYVLRKKVKTLIIFCVLLCMSTMTLSGVAVKKATDNAAKETFKTINSSFSMQINRRVNQGTPRGSGNIKGSDIEKISKTEGISGYVKRMGVIADVVNHNLIELTGENAGQISEDRKQKFGKAAIVTGINDSSKDDRFVAETFTLKKGRHLKNSDENKALVHEEFAKKNNLKIGDKFKLKSNPYDADNVNKANETVEVEIVGFFGGKNKAGVTYPQELYENYILTDISTTRKLYNYNKDNEIYQDATFFVKGGESLEKVMERVQKLPIDWQQYQLLKSSNNFPVLQQSIDAIYGVADKLFIGSLIFSGLVLTLILFLWINGRRKEIGIRLSIGVKKSKIFGQFLIEILLVSVFGFIGSFYLGKFAGKFVGKTVLSQVASSLGKSLSSDAKGQNIGGGADADGFNKMITELDVNVSPSDMKWVVIMGIAVIVIAVGIASYKLITKHPKELLSDID